MTQDGYRYVRALPLTPRYTVSFTFEPAAEPTTERSLLADAEFWLIAQVRGNTDINDDKCIHFVLSLVEAHYGFPKSEGGARKRLEALSARCDEMSPRGRAVVLGLWGVRLGGAWHDEQVRRWIDEAREMEEAAR